MRTPQGNTHESLLNAKLAHLLRTRGIEAHAEQQVVALASTCSSNSRTAP